MTLLIAGMLLWSATHFLPSVGSSLRGNVIDKIGMGPYKGLFSVSILASVALMIFGWKSAEPTLLYEAPTWGAWANFVLIFIAVNLITASDRKTNIKQVIRHPQLTGIALWGIGHLCVNSSDHSVILFGGFALWAMASIFLINARQGTWVKPEKASLAAEITGFVISMLVFVVALFIHDYISGFMPIPF